MPNLILGFGFFSVISVLQNFGEQREFFVEVPVCEKHRRRLELSTRLSTLMGPLIITIITGIVISFLAMFAHVSNMQEEYISVRLSGTIFLAIVGSAFGTCAIFLVSWAFYGIVFATSLPEVDAVGVRVIRFKNVHPQFIAAIEEQRVKLGVQIIDEVLKVQLPRL